MGGETSGRVPAWVDQDACERVRPYVIAGDRTGPRHDLRLDTMVAAVRRPGNGARPHGTAEEEPGRTGGHGAPPEAAHVVRLCRERSRPVAELAGLIGYPILITKIIVSDLLDSHALFIPLPARTADAFYEPGGEGDEVQLMQALLVGLRNADAAVA